ncbi:type IV secretion system protein [Paraburkholderia youngii]|uniref:type IV secretion system protein n=1 Tax=Paraburkholderia youngii TaxID=2782701 RepID=UPI003D1A190D
MTNREATSSAGRVGSRIRLFYSGGAALLMSAAPGMAHAGIFSSGCPANAGVDVDVNTIGSIVNWFVSPLVSADTTISNLGMSLATSYNGTAYTIAGILASAWFMWCLLRQLADGGTNYVALAIDATVPMAMTSATLHLYSNVVQGLAGIFINAVPTSAGGVSGAITTFATSMLQGFANAVNAVLQTTNCFDLVDIFVAGVTGHFGDILHAYFLVLLMFIALVIAVIAVAEIVGVMLMGSMFAGVALALGPLFIACAVSEWSRHYMMGWIKFLGGAYLYKGLITVVLTLIAPVVTAYTTANQASLSAPTGPSMGSAIALMAVLWVLRHIIIAIPKMAKALVGGHAHSVSTVGDIAAFAARAYRIDALMGK